MKALLIKLFPCFLFLSMSGLLIATWFRDGQIYGGGDVGLQTYNPQRILDISQYTWWDSAAPGSPVPQSLVAIPLQFILFLLQSLGFSPVALQATLFFVLLFLGGFGMYLFLKYKLENKALIYPFLGGLFYMFNPYMMIQVWHRFTHTTIILAAVLPFFAIFWDKWITKGKVRDLAFFLLTGFLAVYIFGTFAYIVTVWIFLLLLTVQILIPWQGKRFVTTVGSRFIFGLVLWIFTSCWWLLPVLQISPAVLSQQHRVQESIETLVNISAQAVLPFSLQLINPFYLFYQAELGTIYQNIIFKLIPWVISAVILFGFINSFKKKKVSVYGIFYLISIFLAKGAAPPFGRLYILGFTHIFALGVMRNPFEKTGLILTFFSTILFVLGLKAISERVKRLNFLLGSLVVAGILVFAWPMLTGQIVGKIGKPAYVQVPSSYKQANTWLSQQRDLGISDGKILHLPLTRGEAVSYKWQYGYSGLDPSVIFFTTFPSISRGFNIQRVDDALTGLSLMFENSYSKNSDRILSLLRAFNVRFIVLHKDLNWLGSDVYNPLETEKVLDSLNFIEKKAEFGDLIIYKIQDQFFGPKIEFHENISYVYPQKADMTQWSWLGSRIGGSFISPIDDRSTDDAINSHEKETLIFPERITTDQQLNRYYDFWVNSQGQYELLADPQFKDVSANLGSKNLKGSIKGNLISFGMFDMKQGLNQISVSSPPPLNLISQEAIQMTVAEDSPAVVEKSLGETFGNDIYELSFEALAPLGTTLDIQVVQNTDAEEDGQKTPRISFQIPGGQSLGWQGYKVQLPLVSPVTHEVKVRFVAKLKSVYGFGNNQVMLRNVQAVRVFGNKLFLRSNNLDNNEGVNLSTGAVSFTRINPVQYEGVLNLQRAGFLFFKEAYHPGWNLQLSGNNGVISIKQHYLGLLYGNAWYIDMPGEYRFKITFEPQKSLYFGILLSGFGILCLGFYGIMFKKVRKDEKQH